MTDRFEVIGTGRRTGVQSDLLARARPRAARHLDAPSGRTGAVKAPARQRHSDADRYHSVRLPKLFLRAAGAALRLPRVSAQTLRQTRAHRAADAHRGPDRAAPRLRCRGPVRASARAAREPGRCAARRGGGQRLRGISHLARTQHVSRAARHRSPSGEMVVPAAGYSALFRASSVLHRYFLLFAGRSAGFLDATQLLLDACGHTGAGSA